MKISINVANQGGPDTLQVKKPNSHHVSDISDTLPLNHQSILKKNINGGNEQCEYSIQIQAPGMMPPCAPCCPGLEILTRFKGCLSIFTMLNQYQSKQSFDCWCILKLKLQLSGDHPLMLKNTSELQSNNPHLMLQDIQPTVVYWEIAQFPIIPTPLNVTKTFHLEADFWESFEVTIPWLKSNKDFTYHYEVETTRGITKEMKIANNPNCEHVPKSNQTKAKRSRRSLSSKETETTKRKSFTKIN